MKRLIIYGILCLGVIGICENVFYNDMAPELYKEDFELCKGEYFYVAYNMKTMCPDYVIEYMKYENMLKLTGGRKGFIKDDELDKQRINQTKIDSKVFSDKINRGHLIPSYSSSWNKEDFGQWFYCYMMSNICPQYSKFNQIEWKNLENQIVNWIINNKQSLYVITGVIYDNRDKPIIIYGTGIPNYFYKILCDPINKQSAGFIGTNNNQLDGETYKFKKVNDVIDNIKIKIIDDCNNDKIDVFHWWIYNLTDNKQLDEEIYKIN